MGAKTEDVVAGIHISFAKRISGLVPKEKKCYVLQGGVARNSGIADAISDVLGVQLNIPPEPQLVNAIGAIEYGWSESLSFTSA